MCMGGVMMDPRIGTVVGTPASCPACAVVDVGATRPRGVRPLPRTVPPPWFQTPLSAESILNEAADGARSCGSVVMSRIAWVITRTARILIPVTRTCRERPDRCQERAEARAKPEALY